MDEKKLIESAQNIKDYCADKLYCEKCVFYKNREHGSSCTFYSGDNPEGWGIPLPQVGLDKEQEDIIKETIANLEKLLDGKKSC